jgi:hypothetical protein
VSEQTFQSALQSCLRSAVDSVLRQGVEQGDASRPHASTKGNNKSNNKSNNTSIGKSNSKSSGKTIGKNIWDIRNFRLTQTFWSFGGIRVSFVRTRPRTEVVRGTSTYKIDVNAFDAQTGKEKCDSDKQI